VAAATGAEIRRAAIARCTTPWCSNLEGRSATSASRRERLACRASAISSIWSPLWRPMNEASRGASTLSTSHSDAVIRTRPDKPASCPDAIRSTESAPRSISSTCASVRCPVGDSLWPEGDGTRSFAPSSRSSAARRRPTVGCATPRARAAADMLPARATAPKKRRSSQFMRRSVAQTHAQMHGGDAQACLDIAAAIPHHRKP
jgi:hypothetical protein